VPFYNVISAIISFVPFLAESGLNLIKGLWQGISDAGAWLWDTRASLKERFFAA